MDEQYLQTLCQNILLALRKAEATLHSDGEVDMDLLNTRVKLFQDYLHKYMPEKPSEDLKTLVYDTFLEIEMLSDKIAEEVKLSKISIAEMANSQKVRRVYSYGERT